MDKVSLLPGSALASYITPVILFTQLDDRTSINLLQSRSRLWFLPTVQNHVYLM